MASLKPQSHRNKELHAAVKSYVVAAIKIARPLGSVFPSLNSTGEPSILFLHLEDQLISLPEYKTCLAQISLDKTISSHLGVLIGSSSKASQSLKADSLMLQLPYLGIYKNEIAFNGVFFEREYARFESGFYSEDLEYEVIAPLLGIRFEKTVVLDETIQICLLNAFDLTVPIETEINQDSPRFEHVWAIRTNYFLRKRFEKSDTDRLSANREDENKRDLANQKIEKVVSALRLLQGTGTFAAPKIHRTRSWFFSDIQQYPLRFEPEFYFTLVTQEHFGEELVRFWKAFESERVMSQKNIAVAARRFSYAHERFDWEDQIIDLLIAAEALFLSATGNQSELKYRLKLHAALYIGTDYSSRKQIFEDMGVAYDLRSKIVHGSSPASVIEKIKQRELDRYGEEYKHLEFIGRIRDYIRFALVRMIRQASLNHPPINWDSLVLNDTNGLEEN